MGPAGLQQPNESELKVGQSSGPGPLQTRGHRNRFNLNRTETTSATECLTHPLKLAFKLVSTSKPSSSSSAVQLQSQS